MVSIYALVVPFHWRILEVAERREVVGVILDERTEVDISEVVRDRVHLGIREELRIAHLEETLVLGVRLHLPFGRDYGVAVDIIFRCIIAHERREGIVIAEVTHRLHHVFLPVLQAVAIPVAVGKAGAFCGHGIFRRAVHTH